MKLNPTVQDFLDYRVNNPCTEQHHLHQIGSCSLLYTDGVKLLAESTQCYWLLTAILSYQPKLKGEDFQSWKLVYNSIEDWWDLSCTDGNGGDPLVTQRLLYSSFPKDLAPLTLWVEGGVVLLPEEH